MVNIPISDTQSALSKTLWLNPKTSKAHLFLPNWYRKGINLPADLIHANGDFMTERTLKSKYHIETNFLEYHRVITCVSVYLSKLKITSKVHQKPNIPNHIRSLLKSKNGSKNFYRTIMNISCSDAKQSLFWEQTLPVRSSDKTWKIIFNACFNTVKNNDLIWMQYRIIYRIIGTKDYLYKLKLSNDCACSLCSDYNETIIHLFVHCEKAKTFWAKLRTLVKSRLDYDLCISAPNIIFGHLSYGDLFIPLNAICMAAKMYIFECARSRSRLTIEGFCNYMSIIYLEQEYVAKLELKHSTFLKIWCNFTDLFSKSSVVINNNQI